MKGDAGGLAVLVIVVAVLAACGVPPVGSPGPCGPGPDLASPTCTFGPTGAPGGLSRDAAIAAARGHVPQGGGGASLVWASVESDPFAPRPSIGGLVWEVRLVGPTMAPPCPSGFLDRAPTGSDPPCLDRDSGIVVVLDYVSGEFIGWIH
jgi:hypothetical protein